MSDAMTSWLVRQGLMTPEQEIERRARLSLKRRTECVCQATTRAGEACRQPVKRGATHCHLHGARRTRPLPDSALSADQLARRQRGRLKRAWAKDPWLDGTTIILATEHDARIEAEAGIRLDDLAPAVRDWIRWRFATRVLRWKDLPRWQDALVELRNRIAWSASVRGDAAAR